MRQICSMEGCTKFVQSKGVCWKHGAKKVAKKCTFVGCDKFAQTKKGGNGGSYCLKHNSKCDEESTTTCSSNVEEDGNAGVAIQALLSLRSVSSLEE